MSYTGYIVWFIAMAVMITAILAAQRGQAEKRPRVTGVGQPAGGEIGPGEARSDRRADGSHGEFDPVRCGRGADHVARIDRSGRRCGQAGQCELELAAAQGDSGGAFLAELAGPRGDDLGVGRGPHVDSGGDHLGGFLAQPRGMPGRRKAAAVAGKSVESPRSFRSSAAVSSPERSAVPVDTIDGNVR